MRLIQVGRHCLNLDFLIRHEVNDGSPEAAAIPPGVVRVVMASGDMIDLSGSSADKYLRTMAETIGDEPVSAPRMASRPTSVNPRQRVAPAAPVVKQRKKRG